METKEIEIEGKIFVVKELKYKDMAKMADVSKEEATKSLIMMSVTMTDDEYDNMSLNIGIKLQKVINNLNGLEDFQSPLNK